MPREIGWSQEANLLYAVQKAVKQAAQSGAPITTTTTTTVAP